MKIVGCDLHTRYQQIAMLDVETGELTERRLEHESGQAQSFYAAGGPPSLCYSNVGSIKGDVKKQVSPSPDERWLARHPAPFLPLVGRFFVGAHENVGDHPSS